MLNSSKLLLLIVPLAVIACFLGFNWWGNRADDRLQISPAMLHEVKRADFESLITEPGEMESAKNIEVRCDVESRGRGGTTILEIVDEGTYVEQGEFLVQFDDSMLREELTAQKIIVANDRASVIQAESDWDTAKRTLQEYRQGIYEQELSLIEAEVAFAEETQRRAEEYFRHSQRLAVRGYVTDSQLEADEYAVVKATKELELARQRLEVFQEFTKERVVAELTAAVAKQQAQHEASVFRLELSETREREIQEQIAKCRVVAPADGMVVYANDNRRGDSSIVIEEGVMIRDGQSIINLPNPEMMQVVTHVNDSKINLVKPGDKTLIWLDSDPENSILGVVDRVANFPLPQRWHQAPIEYEVFVRVVEVKDTVRPGLRAKVQIFVEDLTNVVQAPVSSLVKFGGRYFVIINGERDLEAREVQVGPNNDKFVVIEGGVAEGEIVIIDAENYRDQVEFPGE